MKIYSWNPDKNGKLIVEPGISFEEIVLYIEVGNEIESYDHPNQEKYPGQKISAVTIEGYVYLVQFIKNEDGIFLKTIIPSRQATKRHR